MGTNDPSLLSQVRSHTGAIEEIVQAARAQALAEGYEAGARMILRTLHQRDRDRLHEQHQRDNELLQRLLDERADLKPETAHQPDYSGPMSEASKFDPGLTILLSQDKRPDNATLMRASLGEIGIPLWITSKLEAGGIHTVGQLLATPSQQLPEVTPLSADILSRVDGCLAQYHLYRSRDAKFEAEVWNYRRTS